MHVFTWTAPVGKARISTTVQVSHRVALPRSSLVGFNQQVYSHAVSSQQAGKQANCHTLHQISRSAYNHTQHCQTRHSVSRLAYNQTSSKTNEDCSSMTNFLILVTLAEQSVYFNGVPSRQSSPLSNSV